MNLGKPFVLLVAVQLAAMTLLIPDSPAIAQTSPSSSVSWLTSCVWESKGDYSRGAALLVNGTRYVCANLRNPDWQPAGVTWVRVDLVGTDLVLARPSSPGFCARTNNGQYSPGATLNVSGETARCATTFDSRFSAAGVGWVDVRPLRGDDFVPRIH